MIRGHATQLGWLSLALSIGALAALAFSKRAEASPNTHAPAISTWDPRASSVVFGLTSAVSGPGHFTAASYSANFSSTSGVLSAQFGVHYVTYAPTDGTTGARGVSAGGVALISLPLSERFENGVPGSSFAFYVGGVPTALISGELNFVSVPLVLGVGLPFSPAQYVTFRPWVELSPGLNFDTRISEVATSAAIIAAQDGTLTREEVQDLVEQGLHIEQTTTVGKRAGLSVALHLGERVDIDLNLMIGAGHAGAASLGGGLVFRWDAMVAGLETRRGRLEEADCAELAARARSCRLTKTSEGHSSVERKPPPPSRQGAAATPHPTRPTRQPAVAPASPPPVRDRQPAPNATTSDAKRKPSAPAVLSPPVKPAPVKTTPAAGDLPPLQAAPPKPR